MRPQEHVVLCPSAPPERAGSVLFGVVGGGASSGLLAYLDAPLPAGADVVAHAAPLPPTKVFRFAAGCAESACVHFDGADCKLARKIVDFTPAAVTLLPRCPIRRHCLWWQQEGRAACLRCPAVVTGPSCPTDDLRRAADPEVPPAARRPSARGVVVQTDRKVVISGTVEHDPTATGDGAKYTDIAVARFDASGRLDPTFGTGGVARLDLSTGVAGGWSASGPTCPSHPRRRRAARRQSRVDRLRQRRRRREGDSVPPDSSGRARPVLRHRRCLGDAAARQRRRVLCAGGDALGQAHVSHAPDGPQRPADEVGVIGNSRSSDRSMVTISASMR